MEVAGGVTEATKALIIKVEGDSPVAGVTGAEVTSTNPMVVAEGDGKPRTANLTRTPGRGASGHPPHTGRIRALSTRMWNEHRLRMDPSYEETGTDTPARWNPFWAPLGRQTMTTAWRTMLTGVETWKGSSSISPSLHPRSLSLLLTLHAGWSCLIPGLHPPLKWWWPLVQRGTVRPGNLRR